MLYIIREYVWVESFMGLDYRIGKRYNYVCGILLWEIWFFELVLLNN